MGRMEIRGGRGTLRPATAGDREALRAMREEPEVLKWWTPQSPGWPGDEEDVELLTIMLGEELAGLLQFGEEPDDDYRHADVDILLATRHHGRGLGTDAMRAITEYLTR